jgi:hypothetical protein
VELADRFTAECWETSGRLKKDIHYNATRFNQMLEEHGGVETARRLINAADPSHGFVVLWEHQRLELSVEALALIPWFSGLFTNAELTIARRRLLDYRFDVDKYLSTVVARRPGWAAS